MKISEEISGITIKGGGILLLKKRNEERAPIHYAIITPRGLGVLKHYKTMRPERVEHALVAHRVIPDITTRQSG